MIFLLIMDAHGLFNQSFTVAKKIKPKKYLLINTKYHIINININIIYNSQCIIYICIRVDRNAKLLHAEKLFKKIDQ